MLFRLDVADYLRSKPRSENTSTGKEIMFERNVL